MRSLLDGRLPWERTDNVLGFGESRQRQKTAHNVFVQAPSPRTGNGRGQPALRFSQVRDACAGTALFAKRDPKKLSRSIKA